MSSHISSITVLLPRSTTLEVISWQIKFVWFHVFDPHWFHTSIIAPRINKNNGFNNFDSSLNSKRFSNLTRRLVWVCVPQEIPTMLVKEKVNWSEKFLKKCCKGFQIKFFSQNFANLLDWMRLIWSKKNPYAEAFFCNLMIIYTFFQFYVSDWKCFFHLWSHETKEKKRMPVLTRKFVPELFFLNKKTIPLILQTVVF